MRTVPWDRQPLHLLFGGRRRRWSLVIGGLILVALFLGLLWVFSEGAASGGDGLGGTLWAVLATVLVIGLLYGSLWAMRLLGQQGRWAREGADLVRLRTSLRLSNNQVLHVVQFGSHLLLVGSSQAGLVLLGKMPADPAPDFSQTLAKELEGEE